ncbi:MAG: hypothetical protein ACRDGE_09200 [Candidatus Limnocylindria bacterium]
MPEKFLLEPYLDWAGRQGVPRHSGFGVDLLAVDVAPWPWLGASGAIVLLDGRGDFVDLQVWEVAPGGSTAPRRHLAEAVVYVIAGSGSTVIETPAGRRSFEWGPKSLFALPLNYPYRLHNASGREPARLAAVTDLPLALNLFHDERFVFENDFTFSERIGEARYLRGEGLFLPQTPGRHMWETNFVPDLSSFELQRWDKRGGGSANIMFSLADGVMHAHVSEMPVGTYKKAHRHGPDFHVFAVTGEGYSIYWYEDDASFTRFDWKHGGVFAPADRMFHQHFNVSGEPARYLAIACGSLRYPFVEDKKRTWLGMDVDVKEGGRQIEYEDEDPRVLAMYEDELRRRGIASKMRDLVPSR